RQRCRADDRVRRRAAARAAHVGRRSSGSDRARADRHHERVGAQRYLDRAAVGGRPPHDEPSVPPGRDRRPRAVDRERARRSRAQPRGNRSQSVADLGGGSRADPAAHRCRGAALQGAGHERRHPAAQRRAGRAPTAADVNPENQLRVMTTRILVSTCFCALLAAPAARAMTPPLVPPAAAVDVDDRADELYSEGRESIDDGKYDRALDRFNRLIELNSSRTDAALYWKAYTLGKLGRRADAL